MINHLDIFLLLDVNFCVHSSFLGTGMRVSSSFPGARSCKSSLVLPGNKITVSPEENWV